MKSIFHRKSTGRFLHGMPLKCILSVFQGRLSPLLQVLFVVCHVTDHKNKHAFTVSHLACSFFMIQGGRISDVELSHTSNYRLEPVSPLLSSVGLAQNCDAFEPVKQHLKLHLKGPRFQNFQNFSNFFFKPQSIKI